MEWLFGRQTTPEEMLRKNNRALERAVRDLDRERARMEQREKRIIADIKKMAKNGQMVSNLLSFTFLITLSIVYWYLMVGIII